MKITLPQKELTAALAKMQNITSGNKTMPMLGSILIEATQSACFITANDLEVACQTAIPGIIWEESYFRPIRIALPAKKLYECIKAIPIGEVLIGYDPKTQRITLSGGTVNFTIAGLEPDNFPSLPDITGPECNIPADTLYQAAAAVAYAQSTAPEKYNLNGVFTRIEENNEGELFLTTVATDGHRMAVATLGIDNSSGGCADAPIDLGEVPPQLRTGIIIPFKGVAQILKADRQGPAVISLAGNHLRINTAAETIYLRLIDGQFPDYTRVMPANLIARVEVKRQGLIDALERCRIMSDKDSRRATLEFTDGTITINSAAADCGQSTDRVTAAIDAPAGVLHINSTYLIEALESFASNFVELHPGDERSAITINPLGTDSTLAVIMPQRA